MSIMTNLVHMSLTSQTEELTWLAQEEGQAIAFDLDSEEERDTFVPWHEDAIIRTLQTLSCQFLCLE